VAEICALPSSCDRLSIPSLFFSKPGYLASLNEVTHQC
jgi:hypothetical protein